MNINKFKIKKLDWIVGSLFIFSAALPLSTFGADSTTITKPPQTTPVLFCPDIKVNDTTIGATPTSVPLENSASGSHTNCQGPFGTHTITFYRSRATGVLYGIGGGSNVNCPPELPYPTAIKQSVQDTGAWEMNPEIQFTWMCCSTAPKFSATGKWVKAIQDPTTKAWVCP